MLSADILKTLESYTKNMQHEISFVLQSGDHPKREQLKDFLQGIASVNENILVQEEDTNGVLRSPISFLIRSKGQDTGIRFSGIPSGHEFNSLVLAMLQASGTALQLDESLQAMLKNIKDELHFEVFISLSCHNCPDVVQTLNQFALINPHIKSEMIDGGLFQNMIKERDIQGVPSVYLNGELFANGKVDAAQLLENLIAKYPEMKQASNDSSVLPVQDVTVIGGGPAGVSAAIYSARKGLNVSLIADRIGGQVKDTMGIENLISVPKTNGPELANALQAHMNEYEINLKQHVKVERVERVEQGCVKKIHLSSGEIIESKTVIVATGAKWRELGVPGEKENIGNGVAYCPHCDGPFFKGKDVAVIGGGNSGIEAALDLAGIVKSVTVFEFLPELKADKVLVEKAQATKNITILRNVASKQILSKNDKVNAIEYIERDTQIVRQLELQGVFVQIGLLPNSDFVEGLVERNKMKEVIVDDKCKTSQEGIFACGDVTTVPYKQIIISMGEGAKAALSAFEYLLTQSEPQQQPLAKAS